MRLQFILQFEIKLKKLRLTYKTSNTLNLTSNNGSQLKSMCSEGARSKEHGAWSMEHGAWSKEQGERTQYEAHPVVLKAARKKP